MQTTNADVYNLLVDFLEELENEEENDD